MQSDSPRFGTPRRVGTFSLGKSETAPPKSAPSISDRVLGQTGKRGVGNRQLQRFGELFDTWPNNQLKRLTSDQFSREAGIKCDGTK